MKREFSDLFAEFAGGGLERREFLKRLALIAGAAAAAGVLSSKIFFASRSARMT